MVFVKDVEAMAQFYRDGFDLTDDADASGLGAQLSGMTNRHVKP
jgi:hypothetical protein